LQRHQCNVEKPVEELVKCEGIIDGEHCTDGKLCVFPSVLPYFSIDNTGVIYTKKV
jgi:hypothetical protein